MADVGATTTDGDELEAEESNSHPWPKPKNRTLDYVIRLLHRYMKKCVSDYVDGDFTVDSNDILQAAMWGGWIGKNEDVMVSGQFPHEHFFLGPSLCPILLRAIKAGVASAEETTYSFTKVATIVADTLDLPPSLVSWDARPDVEPAVAPIDE